MEVEIDLHDLTGNRASRMVLLMLIGTRTWVTCKATCTWQMRPLSITESCILLASRWNCYFLKSPDGWWQGITDFGLDIGLPEWQVSNISRSARSAQSVGVKKNITRLGQIKQTFHRTRTQILRQTSQPNAVPVTWRCGPLLDAIPITWWCIASYLTKNPVTSRSTRNRPKVSRYSTRRQY